MTSKTVQTTTRTDVLYKIIKDGYKTVTETINVVNSMPTRTEYNLVPSSTVHNPNLNYTIDTTHDYPPIITFNDNVISPDDTEIKENKYVLAPYGEDYLIIDGSEDVDNFTKVGNINVDTNGEVNSFSKTNYIFFPGYTSSVTSFEFVLHLKTPSNWRTDVDTETLGLNQFDYKGIMLYFGSARGSDVGKIGLAVENVIGSSWYQSEYSSFTFLTNTEYYIKTTYSNNQWNVYYSIDNETWTEILSLTAPYPTSDSVYYLGNSISSWSGNNWFTGTIYLNDSYIKINNVDFWVPTWKKLYQQYYPTNDLYITDGIANNFNSSNYIKLLGFQPGSQSWEIGLKVYLTSTSGTNAILGCVENRYYCPYLSVVDGKITLYLSSNGSSWNIANNRQSSLTISANAWHTIRLLWTKTYYQVYVDGSSYISFSNSTPIIRNSYPLCIGKYLSSNIAFTNGTVDLNDSYIKVNNEYVWRSYDIYKCGDYTMMGSPVLTGDYETFGFNSSNYYTTPLDLTNYTSFEIYMKITTPSDTTDTNGAFFSNNTTNASPFRRDGTTLTFWSPNTGSVGSYQMSNGTTHLIKGYSNGTTWYLYGKPYNGESLDEIMASVDWSLSGSCTASYILYNGNNNFVFGRNTNNYVDQYFRGSIDLKYFLIKKDGNVILNGVNQGGAYMPGILDPNYIDDGDQKILNLYDVQIDKRKLILNTNRNLNIPGKKYVQYDGQMNIPDHGLSIYDSTNKTWSKYRFITLNVNDQDTTIYTEGNI